MSDSPRGAALRSLHEETASKDLTIAELRLQVAELRPAQQEALALRRQLELLDERIRGRDSETHARVGEMSAKLELHESVEEQLERQLLRGEEERLQLSEQLIAAERLRIEAQAQMQQAAELQRGVEPMRQRDEAEREMARQLSAGAQHVEGELQAASALKKAVRFGGSDSIDEPPTISRPPSKSESSISRPPSQAESSSAKTEAGQSSMSQAPAVYITEHDESPPPRRGIARLSQAFTAVMLMNKAQQGTLNPTEAFFYSRALTRNLGDKGTDHQGLKKAGEMDGSDFSCEPHASDSRASSSSRLSLIPP